MQSFKIRCPTIFCLSWWWLECLEQVDPLYKECQWHTNEDQTMCESKASIWTKTVHWCQCNSYEGMHKHIEVPSRYLTNCNEQFCLLSFPLRAVLWSVPLIAYLHGLKLLATLLFIGLYKKRYCTATSKGKTTGSRLFTEIKPCCTGLISRWVTMGKLPCALKFLGKSGWCSKHQSRLQPLRQMLYVDWVSVDLNLTLRVFSGHSGFLPSQNRLPV